jgi:hypothetical protein
MYRCNKCGDSWMEENQELTRRCIICRSVNIEMLMELPSDIAHEMLRRNPHCNLSSVTKVIEDSSAKTWKQNTLTVNKLFEEQVGVLTSLYMLMETAEKNV